MAFAVPLSSRLITLESALVSDRPILTELAFHDKKASFCKELCRNERDLTEIVALHLGVPANSMTVSLPDDWIWGSFNVCIPIYLTGEPRDGIPSQVILRVAQPFKNGEEHFPGNIEEKAKSEAATYVWLNLHCPRIPLPKIHGYGTPGGDSVTITGSLPYPVVRRQTMHSIGYILLEFVTEGKLISFKDWEQHKDWEKHLSDPQRTTNLYRSLARIMLDLAQHPMPRIGSWTFGSDGSLQLSNRPLLWWLQYTEALGVDTGISRDCTYSASDPYYYDLLAFQDQRLRQMPNAIHNKINGHVQLAMVTAMRAIMPRYCNRALRDGPFVMFLTDFHRSNFFVDEEWNITTVLDLEWACSRPIEMLSCPKWLSGELLEDVASGGACRGFLPAYEKFVRILGEEERSCYGETRVTDMVRANWDTGAFWYFAILDNPSMLQAVFFDRVYTNFMPGGSNTLDDFCKIFSAFWDVESTRFIASKVKEEARYRMSLRSWFNEAQRAARPAQKRSVDDSEGSAAPQITAEELKGGETLAGDFVGLEMMPSQRRMRTEGQDPSSAAVSEISADGDQLAGTSLLSPVSPVEHHPFGGEAD